jgi:hypothetical protein
MKRVAVIIGSVIAVAATRLCCFSDRGGALTALLPLLRRRLVLYAKGALPMARQPEPR